MFWIKAWCVGLLLLAAVESAQSKDLYFGIFPTQRQSNVRPDIAALLAQRLGLRLLFVNRPGPIEVIECLKARECDAAFLHRDERAQGVLDFSYPLIYYEFTLLVPEGSAIKRVGDANRLGVLVVGLRGHASTRAFSRASPLANVGLVETPEEALSALRSGNVEAIAGTRHTLTGMATKLPGPTVLEDHYGENVNRIAILPGNPARLAEINAFVESVKASGELKAIVDKDTTGAEFVVHGPGETK